MPTSTNVTNLKINELTEAQFDSAVSGGVIGANEISILTDMDEAIQVDTMPTASADELGKVYQFVGTTDANYTHGYFYECVSDGATPAVYSWSNIQVQASSGGLPDQTGNAGKFLTTDGTDASWGNSVDMELSVTHNVSGIYSYGGTIILYKTGSKAVLMRPEGNGVLNFANSTGSGCQLKNISNLGTAGSSSTLGAATNNNTRWANVYTAKINAGSGAGDITVPTVAGSMAVQVSTVPTADSTLEGQIYQFVGATDSTYTNGHFYKCVSDGQATPTYSWTEVSMGGGSSYTAGTGIDITGGVISVTNPTLQNDSTNANSVMIGATTNLSASNSVVVGKSSMIASFASNGTVIGYNSSASTNAVSVGHSILSQGIGSISIGAESGTNGNNSISIGRNAHTSAAAHAIQLGTTGSSTTNSDANTFKVANANGNFEMMSADGTIPTARLTKVNSTITLTAAGWSSNTQTVNVTGMTATGVVMVSPDPADQSAYTSAGVLCTAQAAGTLTFTCDTVPSADIDVVVIML